MIIHGVSLLLRWMLRPYLTVDNLIDGWGLSGFVWHSRMIWFINWCTGMYSIVVDGFSKQCMLDKLFRAPPQ